MSMLFFDSFKHVDDGYELLKWDEYSSIAHIAYDSTYGESGWGVRLDSTLGAYIGKALAANKSEIIVGTKIKFSAFSDSDQFISIIDSASTQVEIRAMLDGSIGVYRGTSTLIAQSSPGVIATNTWYLISAKIIFSNTVGKVDVQVGKTSVISTAATLDTCETANEYCNKVRLYSNSYAYTYANDFFIFDTTGTKNNAIPNSIASTVLYPTSDGTYTDFTPSTGTSHYALVDDAQLVGDTDHNESSTIGHKDSYGVTTYSSSASILGVQVCTAVRNSGTGSMSVQNLCRSGTTPADNFGSGVDLSTTMKAATTIFEQEPTDAVDWTDTKINAAEFGLKVSG